MHTKVENNTTAKIKKARQPDIIINFLLVVRSITMRPIWFYFTEQQCQCVINVMQSVASFHEL